MNIWFLIIIITYVLCVGMHLSRHGEEIKGRKYNFFAQLFASAISLTLIYMAIKTGF
jgi:hypothetical protein